MNGHDLTEQWYLRVANVNSTRDFRRNKMGYIEIIRPDGTGFSTKNSDELEFTQFMTCDKCEQVVDRTQGKYIESNGELIMWWCSSCRT
jgi:hypothetical protein